MSVWVIVNMEEVEVHGRGSLHPEMVPFIWNTNPWKCLNWWGGTITYIVKHPFWTQKVLGSTHSGMAGKGSFVRINTQWVHSLEEQQMLVLYAWICTQTTPIYKDRLPKPLFICQTSSQENLKACTLPPENHHLFHLGKILSSVAKMAKPGFRWTNSFLHATQM